MSDGSEWKVDAIAVDFETREAQVRLSHVWTGAQGVLDGEIEDLKPGGELRPYAERYYRRTVREALDGTCSQEVVDQIETMSDALDLPNFETMAKRIERYG